MLTLLNNGKGFMPSFKQLSDSEKNEIIAFIFGQKAKQTSQIQGVKNNVGSVPYIFKVNHRFMDQNGYPAVKPPWGTLSAIDLNKGIILWQIPLGEFNELTEKGLSPTGTENYGGPAVTAGGIIFIGASKDEFFRAFDTESGKELWKYKLPAGGYATPSVYQADGKQFVVIACGGGKMSTHSGDSYIAFALKEE